MGTFQLSELVRPVISMSDDEEVVDPEKEKLKNLPPLHIRQCDLPEFLFKKVLLLVMDALKENKMEKDVAGHVKKKLDEDPEFNELPGKGPWQCIVGKSFAGAITHEAMHLMFFDVIPNQQTFLCSSLWRCRTSEMKKGSVRSSCVP